MDRKVMEERAVHSPEIAASPYRFLVRELVRRPGAQHEVDITFPVPAVLGTDVIAVPEGVTAELHARFDAVTDGIWVAGSFQAEALGECSRCLDEVRLPVDVPIKAMFFYSETQLGEDQDANDEYAVDGDAIDLEPAVRDAVVTSLPFTPLCAPDCQGLCDQCGARLADNPGHAHEVVDARWAALEVLQDPKKIDTSVTDRNARSGEKES